MNEQTKEDAAGGYSPTRFNALICCAKSDCLAPFGAVHLHHRLFSGGISMARTKNEVLTIRTTAEVKALLKLAAERERRSAASMIEVLVLDYAKAHGLHVSSTERAAKQNRIHDE